MDRKKLQGNQAIKTVILGEIDFTHSACSETLDEPVCADFAANVFRCGLIKMTRAS